MKVRKLVELYLKTSDLKGNEPGTAIGYRGRLRLFLEEFGERKVKSLKVDEILEHFHRTSEGLSSTTQRQNLVQIEQVQKFAIDRGKLKTPWFRRGQIPKPKANRRTKFLTPAQTAAVLAEMRVDARPIYRAIRLTGCRPGEACRALIEQIEGEPGERVIVQAKHKTARKTGKPRRILLIPKAEELVAEQADGRTEGPIFRTVTGRPWRRDRLSREFRRCRDKLGISREICLYSARHEAITSIAETEGILAAKEQAGHEDIGTTQIYTHPKESVTRAAAARAIQDIEVAA